MEYTEFFCCWGGIVTMAEAVYKARTQVDTCSDAELWVFWSTDVGVGSNPTPDRRRVSGWPSGLRRQTQVDTCSDAGRLWVLECPLMWAWVRIPLLTEG
ncbi:hypothetical protein TNIN_355111 [Trichonephila inaurata madagascariensis]|uniref:Uncharacterized protein n=1 Tax=Trichonephila inaurata madagascariensis TaxID=2747483 RepID=A0A8X6X4K8_9ARAC|nr:hypothetical protein TNIN_355111 [Trichonephila inaurata madagascariensis]